MEMAKKQNAVMKAAKERADRGEKLYATNPISDPNATEYKPSETIVKPQNPSDFDDDDGGDDEDVQVEVPAATTQPTTLPSSSSSSSSSTPLPPAPPTTATTIPAPITTAPSTVPSPAPATKIKRKRGEKPGPDFRQCSRDNGAWEPLSMFRKKADGTFFASCKKHDGKGGLDGDDEPQA